MQNKPHTSTDNKVQPTVKPEFNAESERLAKEVRNEDGSITWVIV